jgi:hypothetical protein
MVSVKAEMEIGVKRLLWIREEPVPLDPNERH